MNIDLKILHNFVFIIMFVMFVISNYVIIYKFFQLKNKPNSTLEERFNFIKNLKKGMWWLDFSATTAPLLGLLGTIFALMEAFQKLSAKGLSSSGEITGAIGFALLATAIGIVLSLWNYLFFKMFQDRISSYKEETKNKLIEEILNEE